jgi:hypothetical protein
MNADHTGIGYIITNGVLNISSLGVERCIWPSAMDVNGIQGEDEKRREGEPHCESLKMFEAAVT